MSKALSLDLGRRTLAAGLEEGLSHRKAAARFKVSAASVSRWRALSADGAVPMHGALGGDRRSHVIEAQADAILEVFHARRDMALAELQGDCREFRVCSVMMGMREVPHGATERATDT